MVLKTDFTRGQENAQDDLNENFIQLSPIIENTIRHDYRYDGSGQADATVKSNIDGTQSYIEISRIGDIVYIRGRINLKGSTTSVLRAKFFDIPEGYRCDFNNAVSWSKYGATNPECVAIAERDGLYFMGNQAGNYYFTQSWFTTDAMPK